MNEWDTYFMKMAELVATKSKDRSTKVGAVVVGEGNSVLSTGYNGFIRGVDDTNEDLHKRPEKYYWSEHAERNAIYNAARNGVQLSGSTLYSSSAPCTSCARAIVQSGIVRVIIPPSGFDALLTQSNGAWEFDTKKAQEILKAAKIGVHKHAV